MKTVVRLLSPLARITGKEGKKGLRGSAVFLIPVVIPGASQGMALDTLNTILHLNCMPGAELPKSIWASKYHVRDTKVEVKK